LANLAQFAGREPFYLFDNRLGGLCHRFNLTNHSAAFKL
jgi:hypothetical protein